MKYSIVKIAKGMQLMYYTPIAFVNTFQSLKISMEIQIASI